MVNGSVWGFMIKKIYELNYSSISLFSSRPPNKFYLYDTGDASLVGRSLAKYGWQALGLCSTQRLSSCLTRSRDQHPDLLSRNLYMSSCLRNDPHFRGPFIALTFL